MKPITIDTTNGLCAALFIGLGASFAIQSYALEIGSAFRMGPGYFPLVLAVILILLGFVVLVDALRVAGEPIGPIAWRGIFLILPAPIFFGLTVRGLGFMPAIFITSFIACFASARMKLLPALALSLAVAVFSYGVFSKALGLPFQNFGPWLPF
ncbi:tripartite tricarboxylate transporter TctB family protein [Mesorhizobium sp. NBSH29]|uniref:tripartite tricarboxylate transporter TctB family protein n=1 Tax=Mesorhizobium sp. NBSH29 TaxID=2654249 RepID=UPI001896646F|nr:tripartite tricarboxylate transporter TctB family protein [Mesorhizobium sp. NBSH29]QPC87521.1 tripartite tricarboxylate transporter TctB family protein [Mesorhizobium sp. NBSH29]